MLALKESAEMGREAFWYAGGRVSDAWAEMAFPERVLFSSGLLFCLFK